MQKTVPADDCTNTEDFDDDGDGDVHRSMRLDERPAIFTEDPSEIEAATWGEVCRRCCVHTPTEWCLISLSMLGICFFLYFFILGLDLLGYGAKVLTGCTAGGLFGDDFNPISGCMIGVLCTVLLQSSSTTTSIVVSLVGAGSVNVQPAIYIVMGANIGTTVTNTIVSMGQMGDADQLERAFAGAAVHDVFNILSVAILLPLEVVSGFLYHLSVAITRNVSASSSGSSTGGGYVGPVQFMVSPVANLIIYPNKKMIAEVASDIETKCSKFYPVYCAGSDTEITYANCVEAPGSRVGLISCVSSTGKCPAFFQNGSTEQDDRASGGVVLFLGLILLLLCLVGLVSILQRLLMGMSTRILYKATDLNGYVAIGLGAGLTMLIQSSSITTSVLTPLVGLGVIQLEQMYPLTLGANLGTTVTPLLAALVSDSVTSLQVSLAHVSFNITGILLFYPIPFLRRIPMECARSLGRATRWWRGFPALYIFVVFFLVPLILLGVSFIFSMDSHGFTVLGSVLVTIVASLMLFGMYWWSCRDGKGSTKRSLLNREDRHKAIQNLPYDMLYIKHNMQRLLDHTCLQAEEIAMDVDDEEASKLVLPKDDISTAKESPEKVRRNSCASERARRNSYSSATVAGPRV